MRISDWSSDVCSSDLVPRGKEPTFVVSCDDEIILAALKDQAYTDDEAEAIDRTAGIASHGREETARAYMDKFFSLRVPMPPHVSDAMPTFVQQMHPDDHPLRPAEHTRSQHVLESPHHFLHPGPE